MKGIKLLAIAAGVIALLATIAWVLRDNLIREISNPLLEKYGMAVTAVSLDALATGNARISHLRLTHESGTTIIIEDLTLPFGKASEVKTYAAGRVSVITTIRVDDTPLELATLIAQFLSLPDVLGDSRLRVGEFHAGPYPAIRDVGWDILAGEQRLRGTVDAVAMSANVLRTGAQRYSLVVSVLPETGTDPGANVTADLQQLDRGFVLTGTSSIALPLWEPVAKLAGIVPPELALMSGKATLNFDIDIPVDATQSVNVNAQLQPTSPVHLRYTGRSGDTAAIQMESADSMAVTATFPDVQWALQLEQAVLLVSYEEWQSIPVSVSQLSCRSGPVCSMDTRIAIDGVALPDGEAKRVEFFSSENIRFPQDGVRIEIKPGASFQVSGLAIAAARVNRLRGSVVSAVALGLSDDGWVLTADAVDADIGALAVRDGVSVSIPVFLENVRVSRLNEELSLSAGMFAPRAEARIGPRRLAVPGLKGGIALLQGNLAADLQTVGLHQNGAITVQHNLESGSGRLNVANSTVSFAEKKLSARLAPWPGDRDLVSGTLSAELEAGWAREDGASRIDGRATITAADLAGFYGETVVTGLSTRLDARYRDGVGLAAEPSSVNVALIETGLAIENLSADYLLDPEATSVDVKNLRMTVFGGIVKADPFRFSTDSTVNTVTLQADSIDLAKLLSLEAFEAIEVSGRIGMRLPVAIEEDTVTIASGSLTGVPPGGVIRYRAGGTPDDSDTSGLGFATRVLSNFEYETLTSDVNLTRQGDLKLQLRLTGRNPDLDEKRPVILNLGIENNVPQMLRSLRATRAVEDVLEKRLAR